jgi:NAD(P)-dependent dehydrogenase (short-subunit alcohol dehydrogenase family)
MSVGSYLESIFTLENKVVMMTGAGGGIGSVIAEGLARAGASMALCDISNDALSAVQKNIAEEGGKATKHVFDISKMGEIKSTVSDVVDENGRVDVLINCAGINKREGMLDVEESTYDRIMDINLKGTYFLSQEVAKHMYEAKKGNIINVASHNSVMVLGGVSVYAATKSAIKALTQSMAVEWAQYGIRANAIAPGHILTPLTTVTWEHPTRSVYLKDRIAMRRPGDPEELVGVTIMLASDASSYISGAMIHVDGGCLAGGCPWDYDTKY